MNAHDWEAISGWLNRWLIADAAERVRLHDDFARERPDLIDEASSLASASGAVEGFLDTPALVLAARSLLQDDEVLAAGTMVGPYRVTDLIARGGMGEVYRALDTRLERDVALKVLARSKSGDAQRVQRFMHEARVTASLDHPNVVRVFDVGTMDEHAYLVAELLDGETLAARIARGALPTDEVLRITVDVAKGLAAAHAAGLVHRDLKPDNIFLTRSGAIKILDFGIAKLAQDETVRDGFSTLTGVVMGTAGYLSPEQIRGERVDGRADLFALGAVMVEMLTGQRAFARQHVVETLHAILHENPAEGLLDRSDVPPAVGDIAQRLLEKSPSARFQSAEDLLVALTRIDRASAATSWARAGRRLARTARSHAVRNRMRWAAAVLFTVAVLGGAAWYMRPQTVRLAVFPFESIPAANDDLLERGLADVLISRLGQLSNIDVFPLSATARRGQHDPLEFARRLGANRVVMGTLQKDGNKVRANVQIFSMSGNQILWAGPVDADATSIFNLQDFIVTRVIEQLAPTLALEARSRLVQVGTRSNEAYQQYLRGRGVVLNPTRDTLNQAQQFFEAAVKLDPGYADAWAGLGTAFKRMPTVAGAAPHETFPRAKNAAERALQIDPDHAEAHSVLGTVAFWYEWDYPHAERLLRRSLELQPSSADSHLFLGHLLANIGRFDEALDSIRAAKALDPAWMLPRAHEGHFLFMARRQQEALNQLNDVVKMAPQFWPGQVMRQLPLLALGQYDEVIRHSEEVSARVIREKPGASASAHHAYALARSGRTSEAEKLLEAIRAGRADIFSTGEALVLHGLGRHDESLERLQAAVDARAWDVTFLGVYPFWDDLRSSPGFRAILSQANLLDVSDRTMERLRRAR